MAKDGTNRGGRRVRAGDKPKPLAEKIAAGEDADIIEFTPTTLEGADLDDAADLVGEDMPSPSEYLSARQKDGKPLGADEIYKETWIWLKNRGCEKLVNKRLLESYSLAFHADTEGLNFRRAFADAGFYLSGCCIWMKPSLVLGRSPYQWRHEPCLYGWKKNGKHQWYSDRKQTTIWEFEKTKKNTDHPTMKPIPLLASPIRNSSMSNTLILDPFGGSGSTLIACEQTDRSCATIELDEKYCDVIVKRYIEQVGSADGVSVERDGKVYKYTELEVAGE